MPDNPPTLNPPLAQKLSLLRISLAPAKKNDPVSIDADRAVLGRWSTGLSAVVRVLVTREQRQQVLGSRVRNLTGIFERLGPGHLYNQGGHVAAS